MSHVIFSQILTLFLLLGVGAAARKAHCLSAEAVKGMAAMLLAFALPMLVFVSFLRPFDPGLLAAAGWMLAASLLVILVLLLAGVLLFRKARPDRRPTLQFITAFSNSGFLGIPLLGAIFPAEGVFFGAVFGMAFNVCAFTLGIMLFNPKGARPSLWKLLLNPVILATLAGVACFVGSVRPPAPITAAFSLVGGMTAPMAMLIIGATLAGAELRDLLGGPEEYAVSAARLLLAPMLTLMVCRLIHAGPLITRMLVILEALPAATVVAVFVETYGGDPVFMSRCAYLSTALSLATIPLVIKVMERVLGA